VPLVPFVAHCGNRDGVFEIFRYFPHLLAPRLRPKPAALMRGQSCAYPITHHPSPINHHPSPITCTSHHQISSFSSPIAYGMTLWPGVEEEWLVSCLERVVANCSRKYKIQQAQSPPANRSPGLFLELSPILFFHLFLFPSGCAGPPRGLIAPS